MTGAKETVELGSFGGKEVGLYYCTVKESCGSRALRAEYMCWQVEELGWALRGKTAPWPFSVCQSMSRGQETRNFAAKMGTVEEIINNVNSCIFSTLSHKWSITF